MFHHSVSQAFLQYKEAGQEVSLHSTLGFANSIPTFSELLWREKNLLFWTPLPPLKLLPVSFCPLVQKLGPIIKVKKRTAFTATVQT